MEFHRYYCFLLGLPRDLLADSPEGTLRLMVARVSTLQSGFGEVTCGALIRATVSTHLPPDQSPRYRVFDTVERWFSTNFFMQYLLEGDRARAAAMGVDLSLLNRMVFWAIAPWLAGRMAFYDELSRVPGMSDAVDAPVVRKIRKLLVRYGHAEFVSNATQYRPPAGTPRGVLPGPSD